MVVNQGKPEDTWTDAVTRDVRKHVGTGKSGSKQFTPVLYE